MQSADWVQYGSMQSVNTRLQSAFSVFRPAAAYSYRGVVVSRWGGRLLALVGLIHICHEVFHLVSLLVSRAVRGLAVPASPSRHRPSSHLGVQLPARPTGNHDDHDATMKNKQLSGIRLPLIITSLYLFFHLPPFHRLHHVRF
jgi:hypothetical protein